MDDRGSAFDPSSRLNVLGYIPGNVVACCRAVNEMKSYLESRGENPTPEQMKIIVETAREVVYNVH